MFDFLKRKLSKTPAPRQFTPEEWQDWNELKQAGLCAVLGPMHDMVLHSIVPYEIGGGVDLYFFQEALAGTALVTMELISPDGTGPLPSRIGTYELLAFSHRDQTGSGESSAAVFGGRFRGLFTALGRYGEQAVLNPGETCEVPAGKNTTAFVVFDEYRGPRPFRIGSSRHGLLLVIEIHRSELDFARENGSGELFEKLRAAGHYPYSDLDRPPVA